jgi:hypothetical protein
MGERASWLWWSQSGRSKLSLAFSQRHYNSVNAALHSPYFSEWSMGVLKTFTVSWKTTRAHTPNKTPLRRPQGHLRFVVEAWQPSAAFSSENAHLPSNNCCFEEFLEFSRKKNEGVVSNQINCLYLKFLFIFIALNYYSKIVLKNEGFCHFYFAS